MSQSRRAGRPEWKVIKDLKSGRFAARVSMLADGIRPRFSLQLGLAREDGSISPHLPLEVEGYPHVRLRQSLTKDLSELLQAAEEALLEEAGLRADEALEKRIEREQRDASFGKGQTRVTGKTAKKKARLKAA